MVKLLLKKRKDTKNFYARSSSENKKQEVSIMLPSEYDEDKQYPCYLNVGWGRYVISKI